MVLHGTRLLAAVLLMVGIRASGLNRTPEQVAPRWPGSIAAGLALFVAAGLASSPLVRGLVPGAPHWIWWGMAATVVSFTTVLGCSLLLLSRRAPSRPSVQKQTGLSAASDRRQEADRSDRSRVLS
jgi:hypothetical protein